MSKAQQVVEMAKQLTGLDADVVSGKCQGTVFLHEGDTLGLGKGWDCPRMGVPRPHLDGETFCDRCNQELS